MSKLNECLKKELKSLIALFSKWTIRLYSSVRIFQIFQFSDAVGLSPTTSLSVAAHRDRVQQALFQNTSDQYLSNSAASRFANILMLLPAIMVRSLHVTLLSHKSISIIQRESEQS